MKDDAPNLNAFEEPTIEGLLLFGVHHGTPDCYCNMALTSQAQAVGRFNITPYAKLCASPGIFIAGMLATSTYSMKER